MIYTYKQGVDRQLKQRIIRGGGLILPAVSLLFIIIAILSFNTHQSSGQSPNIPIQTKSSQISNLKPKAPGVNSKKGNPSQGQNGSSSAISLDSGARPAMSFGSLSSPVSQPAISAPTPAGTGGGLGGGDIAPGDGGSSGGGSLPTGSGGGASSPPAPTLACTNLLSLAQVCTACSPPLTLQPGQKALLSSNGTCTSVN